MLLRIPGSRPHCPPPQELGFLDNQVDNNRDNTGRRGGGGGSPVRCLQGRLPRRATGWLTQGHHPSTRSPQTASVPVTHRGTQPASASTPRASVGLRGGPELRTREHRTEHKPCAKITIAAGPGAQGLPSHATNSSYHERRCWALHPSPPRPSRSAWTRTPPSKRGKSGGAHLRPLMKPPPLRRLIVK